MATFTYRLAEYHVTNMLPNHWQYSAAVNNIYTGCYLGYWHTYFDTRGQRTSQDYITGPLTLLTKGFHNYFIAQDLLTLSPFQLAKDGI